MIYGKRRWWNRNLELGALVVLPGRMMAEVKGSFFYD